MGAGHDHGSSPSVPGAPADHRVRLWIAFGLTATIVLARTVIAAALLLPLALARGQVRSLLPYWRPLLAFSLVEICLPWWLLGYAEQRLSSSLTGLLVAAVPLVGACWRASGWTPSAASRRRRGWCSRWPPPI